MSVFDLYNLRNKCIAILLLCMPSVEHWTIKPWSDLKKKVVVLFISVFLGQCINDERAHITVVFLLTP